MGQQHPPGADVRVSPWVDVSQRREWADSSFAAYRIWQRASTWGWEQRHEWRHRDGVTRLDPWIRGAAGWCEGAEPMPTEEEA